MDPKWLEWAKSLQALAQSGLTFSPDPYDKERYEAIRHIAAEMMSTQAGLPLAEVSAFFTAQTGYATPKVDVRAAVFRGDSILLVKEKEDGLWTLPGGWADVNDSPSEAVVKEVGEESGYQTRAVRLMALYDRNKHPHPAHPNHIYKLFFLCEITGGRPESGLETEGVAFFEETALPKLSLSRILPAQIARLFELYRRPDWPPDFD